METRSPGTGRRVAFITPEFVTEADASGGVASYVLKMALALAANGVDVEVFVPSTVSGLTDAQGIRVERVRSERSIIARALARMLILACGPRGRAVLEVLTARRLARAVERRHREKPFDVIQSSNHQLTGSSVRRAPGRVHVTRISTSRWLYDRGSGWRPELLARFLEWADVRALRRADLVYAPSSFLATHFREAHGLDVAVVRPPAELGERPLQHATTAVPDRYLVHFGALSSRKGTDLVARALAEAWRAEPELRMVWIGPLAPDLLARFRGAWGERSTQVSVLGRQDKATLYGLVSGAIASVLPSTVDNLPNTVIESLILGVPVIGSAGASIDELIEDGVSGRLIPIGDASALAEAMVEAWRGHGAWVGDGFRPPAILAEMRPDRAVQAFLAFVSAAAPRHA